MKIRRWSFLDAEDALARHIRLRVAQAIICVAVAGVIAYIVISEVAS